MIVEHAGKLKDVELKVTNFESEDKGVAMLAGDIFDVPIRPDIVHRVVRWQLAKRRQVMRGQENFILFYLKILVLPRSKMLGVERPGFHNHDFDIDPHLGVFS